MATIHPGRVPGGRARECEELDHLLDRVRGRRSQVLVLCGEAGIGKTALLDYVEGRASGCHVARATGVESEMELSFAGLHQLCAPMLDRLEHLPGPQQEALGIAFGLRVGTAPDRFRVSLAALGLLSSFAEKQPLVCLVDDAQWLDRASAQVLGFVARRLFAESVGLVFAVRDPSERPELAGLPPLDVRGLSTPDARALFDWAIPWRVDERVKDRIVAESRGNPLALQEMSRAGTVAQLAGGYGATDAAPLTGRIEKGFQQQALALPDETRRLLRIAAAEPLGDLALLWRAARHLGVSPDAAAAAESADLIELRGGRVYFRHPLVRAALHATGTVAERRAIHAALAEATDAAIDPDRRAWHRALAVLDEDEALALELEASAARAQARGGLVAAAAFLERAALATPDPSRRTARLLSAAAARFDAGMPDAAHELVVRAASGPAPLDELQRARIDRMRAQIVFARRRGGDAPRLLLDAARRLHPLDAGLARDTYLEAIGAAIYAGRLAAIGARDAATAARTAPPAPQPPRLTDLLLEGMVARFTGDYTSSIDALRRALSAFRRQAVTAEGPPCWLWIACPVAPEPLAADLWDDEAWHELAETAVHVARDAGALAVLPIALTYRAGVHVHAGEFAAASALLEEADAITLAMGNAPLRYGTLSLAAWRGDEAPAVRVIDQCRRDATARGDGRALGLIGYVTAVLNNGLGRYDAALAGAEEACEDEDLGFYGWSLVELIEAAARTGAYEKANAALQELESRTRAAGTDWGLGMLDRSRALLSDGAIADALYRESIERLARCRIAVHAARARLIYGEWLRRENRRVDAREQLRAAFAMLDDIGADAFAERARRELLATGETVRKRTADSSNTLTAQETQIALLAAEGRTNPEIAARLFISARTAEYHLHKVFAKLGINSRRELHRALPVSRPHRELTPVS
jgi:DNA-binding CsgD family transcriptional regulator